MWFLHQRERLQSEVVGVESLLSDAPWLASATPRVMDGLRFAFEFDLLVNGETLRFTLAYPSLFPETPPSVLPLDGRRHSSHQWGSGGELCLEYRTDNWDPAVTGAMMIESAYRLLSGEQPSKDHRAVVPTAHQVSLGQKLRSTKFRALVTSGLRDQISTLHPGTSIECEVVDMGGPGGTWTAYVATTGAISAPNWREESIPLGKRKGGPGLIVRLSALDDIPVSKQEDLEVVLSSAGIPTKGPPGENAHSRFTVLADATTVRFYCSFLHEDEWTVVHYDTVDLSHETSTRLPKCYSALAGKAVGIVGCGSLGAKIATSLARGGVRRFILIDDDILKPGNLVRNELQADSLGAHKVNALEEHLYNVANNLEVKVWPVALGGQESSAITAKILDELARCDLLIDATADPQAFNLVASVARRARRPMIWSEVYAGGIGGFVGRLRPDIEPPPHSARRQYSAWCRKQGVQWRDQGNDYSLLRDGNPHLIADDADVGAIAAHTVRMALDVLIRGSDSSFPHPAYVIGLAKDWIFDQPFDTHPIDLMTEGEWQVPVSADEAETTVEYLVSLLHNPPNESRTVT